MPQSGRAPRFSHGGRFAAFHSAVVLILAQSGPKNRTNCFRTGHIDNC